MDTDPETVLLELAGECLAEDMVIGMGFEDISELNIFLPAVV